MESLAIDIFATLAFAISGALVASRKQMDIVGFAWLATVTGVGGGTVRDLILDVPVFWIVDPTPVLVCLASAIVVYFTAHLVHSRIPWLVWMDAAGLSLVTIAGAAKALDVGMGPIVSIAMGIITGSVGGIIRDLIGQEPSIVLRREIYVTASLAGAIIYVFMIGLDGDRVITTACGLLTVFAIRGFAIVYGWALPTYRARPGRPR